MLFLECKKKVNITKNIRSTIYVYEISIKYVLHIFKSQPSHGSKESWRIYYGFNPMRYHSSGLGFLKHRPVLAILLCRVAFREDF